MRLTDFEYLSELFFYIDVSIRFLKNNVNLTNKKTWKFKYFILRTQTLHYIHVGHSVTLSKNKGHHTSDVDISGDIKQI